MSRAAMKRVTVGDAPKGKSTVGLHTFGPGMYRCSIFDGVQTHDAFFSTSQLTNLRGQIDRVLGEGRQLKRQKGA